MLEGRRQHPTVALIFAVKIQSGGCQGRVKYSITDHRLGSDCTRLETIKLMDCNFDVVLRPFVLLVTSLALHARQHSAEERYQPSRFGDGIGGVHFGK